MVTVTVRGNNPKDVLCAATALELQGVDTSACPCHGNIGGNIGLRV